MAKAKKVVHKKVRNGDVTLCMRQISENMNVTSDDKKVTCKQCKKAIKDQKEKDEQYRASYRAITNARKSPSKNKRYY
jgi:hypothetical protein